MWKLKRTKPFLKQYVKLPPPIRKKIDRQLVQLIQNMRHPTLQVKKMVNRDGIWEARIDLHYRMTFKIEDDLITLRRVGTHEIYRNP